MGAVLRHAITGLEGIPEIAELVDVRGGGDRGLLDRARHRAAEENRPLRLAIVGCGINAPALLEDLAAAGAGRFALTMLAPRPAFETYLGRADRAGVEVRYEETQPGDPERLRDRLAASDPDVVVVTPSPMTWDLRNSDAEASLALLHSLRAIGPDVPVLAELFLPESAERLPEDRRLLPVCVLEAVAAALALSVFNPERSDALVHGLDARSGGG